MFPDALFEKYKSKGVLIDSNLLLLLAVGFYRRQRVETFKRTRRYSVDDFNLMWRVLGYFERCITTPNILTEVNNLMRNLDDRELNPAAAAFSKLIAELFEVYVPSSEAVSHAAFPQFGLTDCITVAATQDVLVITDDLPLFGALSGFGRDALNISHIRMLNWT